MVAGNAYGDGVTQGGHLFHQDSFTRHTTHFHQLEKDLIAVEFPDGGFLAGLQL